ncbi:NAD(P)H-dependent oxidoreductase [Patescibacteria group bacterium]|nr:MAG: NAD(P)H-dependent oxidoreductase [Patescibacteria group bacterium]
MSLTIIGISGSLRKDSWNTKLLKAAVRFCPPEAKIDILDWSKVPVYNGDDEANMPAPVLEAKNKIRAADAVLFVTPEYNYSVPGSLKNVIDWCSRPYGDNAWQGKPVALMGASPGNFGTLRAQMALRQTFTFSDMQPVMSPEVFVGHCAEKFDARGEFTDEKGRELVTELLANLVALTQKLIG